MIKVGYLKINLKQIKMKKEKGKIYTNPTGDLVVMCLINTQKSDLNFVGVVLFTKDIAVEVGTLSNIWSIDNFTEKIGPLYLNNVTINN